jgi:hypothetical protein
MKASISIALEPVRVIVPPPPPPIFQAEQLPDVPRSRVAEAPDPLMISSV